MIIGLFLRHIKAYKGITFIPIGCEYNFTTYLGENGSGKSSILEALNSFFNYKDYSINKSALKDGIKTEGNFPFVAPIFLIEKSKVTRFKKEFDLISKSFWEIDKKGLSAGTLGSMKDFFELRENLKEKGYSKDTHYLIVVGEKLIDNNRQIYFASFSREPKFIDLIITNKEDIVLKEKIIDKEGHKKDEIDRKEKDLDKELSKREFKEFYSELKNLYSFVYIPVEINVEDFTKIETDNMQKIFDKKIKDEINDTLKDVKIGQINGKLNLFLKGLENILNTEYFYDTGDTSKKRLTKNDLVDKILEVYFQKRVLNKYNGINKRLATKISELSAGEKRQALISLIYAFLKKEKERNSILIIGIDEPENSLHTSLCYEQFEKLKEISENNQILITTHWYGFLPIISKGIGHFLTKEIISDGTRETTKEIISFDNYDLYDYKAQVKQDIEKNKNKIPRNYTLKSTNDLVQSIFYSLIGDNAYNWLICEGVSEKIYFEYFFANQIKENKLRILPVGGQSKVSEIYEYLELPIKNEKKSLKGKVYCLIDTDRDMHKTHISDGYTNLIIRRLYNEDANETKLLALNNSKSGETYIENSLNPIIFKKVLDVLDIDKKYSIQSINNNKGNTDFIKNLENLKLGEFFKENEGENKIKFAKKYIETMKNEENSETYIPDWINEIKNFYN